MDDIDIGSKLMQILEENDMRVSDMRIDLHVAPATLSSWLHNTRTPGAYHVKMIAEKYKVSADWLLGIYNQDCEHCEWVECPKGDSHGNR